MKQTVFFILLVSSAVSLNAQNDLDAIRYSRVGVGGTSRFVAMGGAFGAVGADLSVAAYNPAGLAVFRKGDVSFSGGLRTNNNTSTLYGQKNSLSQVHFAFNNFGIAGAWKGSADPDNRHVVAFSSVQVLNFKNTVRMTGYTKNSSISRDMLNLAQGNDLSSLQNSYEGLAYDTFLMDYDSVSGKYFSFIDQNRTVSQTRDLVTTGRVNDLNFSYAFTYQDKYYIGASLGFPQVEYASSTFHSEADDRDSMRIENSGGVYSDTYTEELPHYYSDKLGFHAMDYEEYFETIGSGFNFKIGGIVRVSDALRLGAYYHTPTIYRLADQYYTTMNTTFDAAKTNPESYTYPESGGTFSYRLVTPAKIGLNGAFLFQKKALLSVDYEMVNYSKAQLSSETLSDFASMNNLISETYKLGHNVRTGLEVNFEPFKVRGGYALHGSPYGDLIGSDFVRNTVSLGAGYLSKGGFYVDMVWAKSFSSENYFLFQTLNTQAAINYNSSMVGLTVGLKF